MGAATAVLLSYMLGSIPFAYLAGRVFKGIDLRQHGSGNLGATNVYRVLGAPAAILVLALDGAKGAIAVLWGPPLFHLASTWPMWCGLAAIVGHVKPVFLMGKGGGGGGKGVATAAGVFGALAPLPLLVALAVFLAVLVSTRYMSLGSVAGAAALPLAIAVTRGARDPLFAIAALAGAFVIWNHRSNLARLRRGEEPRFGARDGES